MASDLLEAAKQFRPGMQSENAVINTIRSKLSLLHGYWSVKEMDDFKKELETFPSDIPKEVLKSMAGAMRGYLYYHNSSKSDRSEFVKNRDARADEYLRHVADTGLLEYPAPPCMNDYLPDEDISMTKITPKGRIGPPQHIRHFQSPDLKSGDMVTHWILTFREPDLVVATCISRNHDGDIPDDDVNKLALEAYPMGKACNRDDDRYHWHVNIVQESHDEKEIYTRWNLVWQQDSNPYPFESKDESMKHF